MPPGLGFGREDNEAVDLSASALVRYSLIMAEGWRIDSLDRCYNLAPNIFVLVVLHRTEQRLYTMTRPNTTIVTTARSKLEIHGTPIP